MKKILVIYLSTKYTKRSNLKKFIHYYTKYKAGTAHKLLICFKGLENKEIYLRKKLLTKIDCIIFIDKHPINDYEFGSLKRILKNYEEFKRDGRISEPVLDSPEDIREEDIKDLTIIEKGHLHELVAKEKQKYKEEREKNPLYIEYKKLKEELKEKRKTAKMAKIVDKTKTRKMRSSKAGVELKI